MATPTPDNERFQTPAAGHSAPAGDELGLTDDASLNETARIILIEPAARTRRELTKMLRKHGFTCDPVKQSLEAIGAVHGASYDVAIIGMSATDNTGVDLLRAIQEQSPMTKVIMLGDEPILDQAVIAMRLGAIDLIARPLDEQEVIDSVTHAIDLAHEDQQRDRRLRKLQRLCSVLSSSRTDEADQVSALCKELETTSQELDDQVRALQFSAEFRSLIEQELDIESLLRVSLEFMLRKTGPTNAAVYLPSDHYDYSLGAYVNYDCPKDAADILLDHLADVLAPKFTDLEDVLVLNSECDLEEHLGDDASWLAESRVIVFACHHEGECLAIVTFFRDRDKPFAEDLLPQLNAIKGVFGKQLAKIVRVHHRMKSTPDWLNADDNDDYGLAA